MMFGLIVSFLAAQVWEESDARIIISRSTINWIKWTSEIDVMRASSRSSKPARRQLVADGIAGARGGIVPALTSLDLVGGRRGEAASAVRARARDGRTARARDEHDESEHCSTDRDHSLPPL
jgi:hypothetical protein